jgi:glyoxylase-like metal-dependent hydrolase (beta-lactamase superfamily II)
VVIAQGGERACFLGDLVPTAAHLPLPWIMGYDLEPLVTLETKKRVLARAAGEGWWLLFEHDPMIARGRVAPDARKGWTSEPVERAGLALARGD